jgi:nitrate reductase assembly molybdenum cofactor insertion protein NarJ
MELKGLHFADVAEIQEAVIDELKKVQTEEFSAAFQKLYDRAKACILVYTNGACFELKKRVGFFLMCLRFKKRILKLLDRTQYIGRLGEYRFMSSIRA